MNVDPTSAPTTHLTHLDAYRHNPAGLHAFVESFSTDVSDFLNRLAGSVDRGQRRETRRLLHSLAGAARNAGDGALAETCEQLSREEPASTPTPFPLETLTARFDRVRESLLRYLEALPESPPQVGPRPDARRPTLLLVEDNASARHLARLALEDRYRLLEAESGRDALALADRESINLAIIDLNLGHPTADSPSGFKLLDLLRHRMPTIVLTVDQRPKSIRRAVESGAWAYILKSADPRNLCTAIETVLARSAPVYASGPNAKALDVATGWLMAIYRLDRETAHQVLMTLANEKRSPTFEVAQEILDSHQFLVNLGRFIGDRFPPSSHFDT